jgi:hypothetical protein
MRNLGTLINLCSEQATLEWPRIVLKFHIIFTYIGRLWRDRRMKVASCEARAVSRDKLLKDRGSTTTYATSFGMKRLELTESGSNGSNKS